MKIILFTVIISILFSSYAKAKNVPDSSTNKEHSEIHNLAYKSSLDAVKYAQDIFAVKLDFTEESINKVEQILDYISKHKDQDLDKIKTIVFLFGSYLAEVYIKHHSGQYSKGSDGWPMITISDEIMFSPWSRVLNRIEHGKSEDIEHYYKSILNLTRNS